MKFTQVPIFGAWLISPEITTDERGHFVRSYCEREFQEHGLNTRWVQCSTSINLRRGTLRGLHFQKPPNEEIKLVRCSKGRIFDVILDLRMGSPSYEKWYGIELTAIAGRMLYVPKGVAHGFQTLEDDTEVQYQISEFYEPNSGDGVRWNDQKFCIKWPADISMVSARDRSYQDRPSG